VAEHGGNEAEFDKAYERLPVDLRFHLGKVWSDAEWAELSRRDRSRLSAWIVHLIASDAADALEVECFDARPETHASRTVSVVDDQGWRELSRIQEESLEAVLRVKAESAERLAERGEDGMLALSAMLCFELPPPSS
jgi:hypothetical protein